MAVALPAHDFRRRLGVESNERGRAKPGLAPDTQVADGTRTHDHLDHNQGLYQLSYRHRGCTTG